MQRQWDFREEWSPQADTEKYIWDILLHRLQCSSNLKPTLLKMLETVHTLPCCESLHSPTQHHEERYLPKVWRYLQPAIPSFLWAGIALSRMLNWISPLREPLTRLKTHLAQWRCQISNSLIWKSAFLMQDTRSCPCTSHSFKNTWKVF